MISRGAGRTCSCARPPLYFYYWNDGVRSWQTCGDCGGEIGVKAKPARLLKKGDKVRVKGDSAIFGEVADLELFLKSYRHDNTLSLVHEDGSAILWPDEEEAAAKPPWKVWRDTLARKGECPCGIPEGVCAYHKKSA